MTTILSFSRNKKKFREQLFRRIGYTDGLYHIFRFGDVVKENHTQLPASADLVAQFIVTQCSVRQQYAKGMVDVLGAFGIFAKMGPRVWLTNHGRALVAIMRDNETTYEKTARHIYFLKTILESDGDYILNLLALLGEEVSEGKLGQMFFERMLNIVHLRKREVIEKVPAGLVRDDAQRYLDEVAKSISGILNIQKTGRLSLQEKMRDLRKRSHLTRKGWKSKELGEPTKTVEHATKPRIGWLSDLGLIKGGSGKAYYLSEYGKALLRLVAEDGFQLNHDLFRVPFSRRLLSSIGLQDVLPAVPNDYWIGLGARIYVGQNLQTYPSTSLVEEFLDEVYHFFQLVKLKAFNQADIEAIYEAIAIKYACSGVLLEEQAFERSVKDLVTSYPDRLHWMSHRRGGGGYIAFKK